MEGIVTPLNESSDETDSSEDVEELLRAQRAESGCDWQADEIMS